MSQRESLRDLTVLKVPRYAIGLIKSHVSSNFGAWLVFLLDLQDRGFLFLSLDLKDIISDVKNREEEKSKRKVTTHQKKKVQNHENIVYIGVNYRVDKETLHYRGKRQKN